MDIQFNIDTACNLRCDYCNSCGTDIFKLNDIKKTLNSLFLIYYQQEKQGLSNILYFHGGEASLHRDVVEILDHIQALKKIFIRKKFVIEFQTNLTFPLERYVEIGKGIDAFSITFHYKELKRKHLLERFYINLDYIFKHFNVYNLDIMLENTDDVDVMHAEILEHVYPYAKQAKHCEMIYGFYGYNNINDAYLKNKAFYDKYNLTERVYHYDNGLTATTNELFENGLNHYGWYCEAGTTAFNVFGNGDVYRCGAHSYNWMQRRKKIHHFGPWKPLFNILESPAQMLTYMKTIHKCEFRQCCGDFYVERHL